MHDVAFLENDTATDIITDEQKTVHAASYSAWGFPCDDVSRKNNNRKAAGNTVKDGSMRTGKVFRTITNHLKKDLQSERPITEFSNAENVMGLADRTGEDGSSNLDWCDHIAREAGMLPIVWRLCPSLLKWKVDRPRLWFGFLPAFQCNGFSESMVVSMAMEVMNIIIGASPGVDLEDMILGDENEFVAEHLKQLQNQAPDVLRCLET
eukprot:10502875-Karenia_brevis.AAC.1